MNGKNILHIRMQSSNMLEVETDWGAVNGHQTQALPNHGCMLFWAGK